ncbi:hypothetical protein FO519_000899 [Halicephalobus sp. NKZ332]|nr:hypothetical protein FO519_000899 [Halicephalobus sp. NKZ332]
MTAATSAKVDVNRLLNSSFKWSSVDLADIQFSDDEKTKSDILETGESSTDFTDALRKAQNIDFKTNDSQPSSSSADQDQPSESDTRDDNPRISDILKHKNPYIAYRRFRDALSNAYYTNFADATNDPLAMELSNHQQHVKKLVRDRVMKRMQIQSEKIDIKDQLTREKINERYEIEKDKLVKQYEQAVKELAEKMISENDDERKQLEAELNAMGDDGEVPANFQYVPNRKQLRRRAGHLNDPAGDQPDKLDPYVPIYQVHWIDHRDIAPDLEIFDTVLKCKSKPAEDSHHSITTHEGRLIIDGKAYNRNHTQIVYTKSKSFGTFPAIMLSLSEHNNCMTLRSTIKGDPRHITVTFNDLETGRVKLAKKPFTT